MPQYVYKNILPEFTSIRKFNLTKVWEIDEQHLGNHSGSIVRLYDAIKDSGYAISSSYNNLNPTTRIDDYTGRVLSYNYELGNGHYYYPLSEQMTLSASIKTFNGLDYYVNRDGYTTFPPAGSKAVYGYPKRNIWYSLWHLFYRTYDASSSLDNNLQFNAVYKDEFTTSSLSGNAYVFSIPVEYYGDEIVKKSFKFTHHTTMPVYNISSSFLYDDGLGNVYDYEHTGSKVGNISYTKGLVIITNSDYRDYFSSSLEMYKISSSANFTFQSSYDVFENEYTCIVNANEFNMTANASAYNSDGSMKDFLQKSSSISENFCTFATTIGLYDNAGDLVVVAKFPKPMRIEKDLDSVFIVRFDTN